jgi:DinB superfamily
MTGRPDITRSRDLLVAALGHAITASRFACRDLSDEEFFWEPVTPCWGIRRRGESDAGTQWGRGEWVMEMWGHQPPRVTTIGWRVVHLAVGTDVYVDTTFAGGTSSFAEATIPGTAADAVALLLGAQDRLLAHAGALDDEARRRGRPGRTGGRSCPCGSWCGHRSSSSSTTVRRSGRCGTSGGGMPTPTGGRSCRGPTGGRSDERAGTPGCGAAGSRQVSRELFPHGRRLLRARREVPRRAGARRRQ